MKLLCILLILPPVLLAGCSTKSRESSTTTSQKAPSSSVEPRPAEPDAEVEAVLVKKLGEAGMTVDAFELKMLKETFSLEILSEGRFEEDSGKCFCPKGQACMCWESEDSYLLNP